MKKMFRCLFNTKRSDWDKMHLYNKVKSFYKQYQFIENHGHEKVNTTCKVVKRFFFSSGNLVSYYFGGSRGVYIYALCTSITQNMTWIIIKCNTNTSIL